MIAAHAHSGDLSLLHLFVNGNATNTQRGGQLGNGDVLFRFGSRGEIAAYLRGLDLPALDLLVDGIAREAQFMGQLTDREMLTRRDHLPDFLLFMLFGSRSLQAGTSDLGNLIRIDQVIAAHALGFQSSALDLFINGNTADAHGFCELGDREKFSGIRVGGKAAADQGGIDLAAFDLLIDGIAREPQLLG